MNTTTRRAVLVGTAALPALTLPAVVAAAAPSPDAELLELGRQFDQIAVRFADYFEKQNAAHERYLEIRPKPPEALRATPKDVSWFGSVECSNVDPENKFYGRFNMDLLREHAAGLFDFPSKTLEGRAKEIVAAYDQWKAADAAAIKRAGYSEDDDAEIDALYAEIKPIEDKIVTLPAVTMEGMKVKARVVYWCACGGIAGDQETTNLRAAYSIVRDLMRMQGCEPMTSFEYDASNPFLRLAQAVQS